MPEHAHASPSKQFFIHMITKDISLQDCILDLLDNSVDGASRQIAVSGQQQDQPYVGKGASLIIDGDKFTIKDNCGGISVANAVDYAFHFGRRPDAPPEAEYAIGVYGIGMKRALFKIGKQISIVSSTQNDGFLVKIDVPSWEQDSNNWDFDLERRPASHIAGTEIEVTQLNSGIGEEFADRVFVNQLAKSIARDYSIFLKKGFSITVNARRIDPYDYKLRDSESFKAIRMNYEDLTGVKVEITAGLAGLPPEDETSTEMRQSELEYYGWFVACNDRVVLPADKTERTVWGDEGFPAWHPQYNGFMGFVKFHSSDTSKLPWTTTKREIDSSDPLYRRAVAKMKDITRQYIDYTNSRKDSLEEARTLETETRLIPIEQLPVRSTMELPRLNVQRIQTATITYSRPRETVRKVAEALGNANMPNRAVGILTFQYFLENKVEE